MISCYLQAQNGFNYQSIFKDANGAVITNTSIVLRLSFIYNSSSGTIIYVETHSLTTPADGVVNLVIGSGTATTGNFSDVDWSKTVIYLKRELDASASGTYIDMGTSLLNGVPKANYSLATQGISYRSNTVSITNLNVTNTITATAFVGDGSGLTGINASVSSSTHLDSNNTIAIGGVVSATNSVAVGKSVLSNNTSGGWNTAVGMYSLLNNTTGDYNSANGGWALLSNTTGDGNTANGTMALYSNTTGANNTANGYAALNSNTTGANNTANGYAALYNNTTGDYNSANGSWALYSNTTGANNTANGGWALFSNTTGDKNTANGVNSLYSNTTGNNNTAIGHYANVGSNNLTNATAIGYDATVSASNKIRLGNTNVTSIEGQVAWTNVSDRRLKKDITSTKYGLETILKLVPVDYLLKSNNLSQIGFIAQDLKPIVPEAVNGTEGALEKGETLGITYTTLIPVLTKAIQQQQQIIDRLLKRIEALESEK